ncbi:uncharacterized protein LOC130550916 [Triplophysa rosa]|uniref:uncharacterized protein LOC130550916 n=1 Tax=Triplophysa rosa TaxID=992332 RepID=UPI002545F0E1|nr:uncharacterized protein LOC130550916 [Triplophysa rosa]
MTLVNTVDLQPSLPVEHFGDFDTGETVFSGINSNSVLPLPQNLEITLQQDALNETSDSNPTLLIPNRPSDDSCSSSLPKENTNDDDVLSRHATAVVMTAREKHHISQSGVNDVVAVVQEYQAQLLNSLRSQLQTVFNRHSERKIQQEALRIFDSFKDPFAAVSTTYMCHKRKIQFCGSRRSSSWISSMLSKKRKNMRPLHKKRLGYGCNLGSLMEGTRRVEPTDGVRP